MSEIVLKPGRERSLLRRHPWIFSGAVLAVRGAPKIGETVDVLSSSGDFIARAAYNPNSNIACRVWTWNPSEAIDYHFFERRLNHAIELRRELSGLDSTNAFRLVHAESDGLPGLILDKYGDVSVIQFLAAGAEFWKADLIDLIGRLTGSSGIYERSDVDVRQLEGLPLVSGNLRSDRIQNPVEITEHGIRYEVDIVDGQKTGFYLDQRDNRLLVRSLSRDRKVLDCFAYTGGFAMNCLVGNASNISLVESSSAALSNARSNFLLNGLNLEKVEFIEQDVFKYLRTLRDKRQAFDLIILDPPKFAPTASQAERAARAYKDINLLALKLLNPGGYLLTFSCSGGISAELFQKIVAGAALDAGADAIIIQHLHQASDHPVALNFPEGAYLKGLLIKKMN